MGVPVVSVVDTNCDPDVVDWIIPGERLCVAGDSFVHFKDFESVAEGKPLTNNRESAIRKLRGPGTGGRRGICGHQRLRTIRSRKATSWKHDRRSPRTDGSHSPSRRRQSIRAAYGRNERWPVPGDLERAVL